MYKIRSLLLLYLGDGIEDRSGLKYLEFNEYRFIDDRAVIINYDGIFKKQLTKLNI